MSLASLAWGAPAGQALLSKIRAELAAGGCVLCQLPKPLLADNFVPRLSERLYYDGLGRLEVPAPRPMDGVCDLASLLKATWGWEERGLSGPDLEAATLPDLFKFAANDDGLKFLVLAGLDELAPPVQKAVAEDLAVWASLPRKDKSSGGKGAGLRLLALVSPLFASPGKDPLLSVHPWWTATGSIDDQLFFLRLAESEGVDEGSQVLYWWLKALCEGFCHDDVELMSLILKRKPQSVSAVVETLSEHPLFEVAQGYLPAVASQPPPPPLRLGQRPPLPDSSLYRELWAEGLLLGRPGSYLHPLLMDREAQVRTIVAGQRQVFLPLVDHMHSMLLSSVEAYFGPWVWERYQPNEEERAALIVEMNPLAFFLERILMAKQEYTESVRAQAVSVAHSWRYIRNAVAHNSVVALADLKRAFEAYNIFYDTTDRFLASKR